jgi:6-pyruvoyltetrahydropterin/6-carboxytetrahydropterin synthase
VRIWREYGFEAAHSLPNVPDGHKCQRLHGHSWRVEIHVSGGIGVDGFVCDYADIDAEWKSIYETVDHQYLNEVIGLENPTSENLARWIWNRLDLPGLSRVVVRETVRSGCEYEGPDG